MWLEAYNSIESMGFAEDVDNLWITLLASLIRIITASIISMLQTGDYPQAMWISM